VANAVRPEPSMPLCLIMPTPMDYSRRPDLAWSVPIPQKRGASGDESTS